MIYVFISRNNHVRKIVEKLAVTPIVEILTGDEIISEDYILFTYTDGDGIIPSKVRKFLKNENNSQHLKGVVGSGSLERHFETYNFAVDKISEQLNVPILAKFDGIGVESDYTNLKNEIEKLLTK